MDCGDERRLESRRARLHEWHHEEEEAKSEEEEAASTHYFDRSQLYTTHHTPHTTPHSVLIASREGKRRGRGQNMHFPEEVVQALGMAKDSGRFCFYAYYYVLSLL